VSVYIPSAIQSFRRSLTWLEVVLGMIRNQAATDIVLHLEKSGFIEERELEKFLADIFLILDSDLHDPFSHIHRKFIEAGICERELDIAIHEATAMSSAISYLHLGRPETILINTQETLALLDQAAEELSRSAAVDGVEESQT
jgi:hypothetical protein